jgi:hypothetical protein
MIQQRREPAEGHASPLWLLTTVAVAVVFLVTAAVF